MASPWLGEFLGSLILILLGDGVVAAVLLKKSKAEGSGWIVITTGWAFAVMCGAFTAIAWKILTLPVCAIARRSRRRRTRLAAIFAALERNIRHGAKARCLLHGPCNPKYRGKLNQRSDCNIRSGFRCGHDFLKERLGEWPCRRAWPILGGKLGLGHRPFSRRFDWIRDKSCTRFRTASCARDSADCRQGRFRLALRADSDCRSACRWCTGRVCSEAFVDLIVSLPIPRHLLLADFSGRWR